MVWFKVCDGFPGHPKLDSLLDDPARWSRALAVWVVAGCYASRYSTDGRVRPARLAQECAAGIDAAAGLADLLEVGLLEERDGDLWMHDFLEYNPTAASVKAEREAAKLRKQKSRTKKRQQNQAPVTDESHRDTPVTVTPLSQPPDPTRPDPTRPDPTRPTHAEDARVSAHVGSQLGTDVCHWLNSHLGHKHNAVSESVTEAGQDWYRQGLTKERIIGAVKLRVAQLLSIPSNSKATLTPHLLFNRDLDKWLAQYDNGATVADHQRDRNGTTHAERKWKTVEECT